VISNRRRLRDAFSGRPRLIGPISRRFSDCRRLAHVVRIVSCEGETTNRAAPSKRLAQAYAKENSMRRILLVSACLGALVFGGASAALANGPHHGPPTARGGYGNFHSNSPYGGWYTKYRGSYGPQCVPGRVAAYPVYPSYGVPSYGQIAPQLGFGVAGRNFSFWLQR
jgi:hypothetical protein